MLPHAHLLQLLDAVHISSSAHSGVLLVCHQFLITPPVFAVLQAGVDHHGAGEVAGPTARHVRKQDQVGLNSCIGFIAPLSLRNAW
jgi:hypothetical protein